MCSVDGRARGEREGVGGHGDMGTWGHEGMVCLANRREKRLTRDAPTIPVPRKCKSTLILVLLSVVCCTDCCTTAVNWTTPTTTI